MEIFYNSTPYRNSVEDCEDNCIDIHAYEEPGFSTCMEECYNAPVEEEKTFWQKIFGGESKEEAPQTEEPTEKDGDFWQTFFSVGHSSLDLWGKYKQIEGGGPVTAGGYEVQPGHDNTVKTGLIVAASSIIALVIILILVKARKNKNKK